MDRLNSDSSSSSNEEQELAELGQMETFQSASSVEVTWRTSEPAGEDAEFLAAEKEAARQATQDLQHAARPAAAGLQPESERSVPDVLGQVADTRVQLDMMRAALAGHVESTAGSQNALRAENDTLRTELAEASAARDEVAELRAANAALQKAHADADAACAALADSNSELVEANAKLKAETAHMWREREFISPRDRELTFDVTCRLMDQMRNDLAAKDQQNQNLTAQIDELTTELEAAKSALRAQKAPAPASVAQGQDASIPVVKSTVAVHGSADLRDEVMAVAEQLIQRSQSLSQQGSVSEPSPRHGNDGRSTSLESTGDAPSSQVFEALSRTFGSYSEPRKEASPRHNKDSLRAPLASVSGALGSQVSEALSRSFASYVDPSGSGSVTTSMVSPRTRTELAHAVMAERDTTSRVRTEEEVARQRDAEARWSTQRAAQEAAERKETEEKAQARQAKRKEIEKQRTEQERVRIQEEMAAKGQELAAGRRPWKHRGANRPR